jgi:hypothetical protein
MKLTLIQITKCTSKVIQIKIIITNFNEMRVINTDIFEE